MVECEGRHVTSSTGLLCSVQDSQLVITWANPVADDPFFLEISHHVFQQLEPSQAVLQDQRTGSQSTVPLLSIHLLNVPDHNYMINASKYKERVIKLHFADKKTLSYAITVLGKAKRTRSEPQSQISEVLKAYRPDDTLASPTESSEPELEPHVNAFSIHEDVIDSGELVGTPIMHEATPKRATERTPRHAEKMDLPSDDEMVPQSIVHDSVQEQRQTTPDTLDGVELSDVDSPPKPRSNSGRKPMKPKAVPKDAVTKRKPGRPRKELGSKAAAITAKNLPAKKLKSPTKLLPKVLETRTSNAKKDNADIYEFPDDTDERAPREKTKAPTKGAGVKAKSNAKPARRGRPPKVKATDPKKVAASKSVPASVVASTTRSTRSQKRKLDEQAKVDELQDEHPALNAIVQNGDNDVQEPLPNEVPSQSRAPNSQAPPAALSGFEADIGDYDAQFEPVPALQISSKVLGVIQVGESALTPQAKLRQKPVTKAVPSSDVKQVSGEAPSSASRGIKRMQPSLVDENVTKKKKIIGFAKNGPKNQGRRPVQRSPLAEIPEEELTSKSHELPSAVAISSHKKPASISSKTTQDVISSRTAKEKQAAVTRIVGSPAGKRRQDDLELPGRKRSKVVEDVADNDGFIPIEFFDAPASAVKVPAKTPRRRKSTHVTENGSPQNLTRSTKDKKVWSNLLDPLSDDVPIANNVQPKAPLVEAPQSSPAAANAQSSDRGSIYPESNVVSPPKEVEPSAPVAKMLPSSPEAVEAEDEDMMDELASSDPIALEAKRTVVKPSLLPSSSEIADVPMEGRTLDKGHADVIREAPPAVFQVRNDDDPFTSATSKNDAVEPDFVQRLRSVSARVVPPPRASAAEAIEQPHADEMEIDSNSSSDVDMDEVEAQDKAAEAEWEAALQPRHRTLLASLNHISRRFLAHVMDCEGALVAEVSDYFRKGSEVLKDMDEKHIAQIHRLKAQAQRGGRLGVDPVMVSKMRVEHKKTKDRARGALDDWQKMHDGRVKQVKDLRARVEGVAGN